MSESRPDTSCVTGNGGALIVAVGMSSNALEMLGREIAIMKKINHPHCVQLFEVIDDPKTERLFLVMELLTGTSAGHMVADWAGA